MLLSDCQGLLRGIVSLRDNDDGTQTPLRFTPGQMSFYHADPGYRIRTHASASICLDCVTDARRLILEGVACPGSSVDQWAFGPVRRKAAHLQALGLA